MQDWQGLIVFLLGLAVAGGAMMIRLRIQVEDLTRKQADQEVDSARIEAKLDLLLRDMAELKVQIARQEEQMKTVWKRGKDV